MVRVYVSRESKGEMHMTIAYPLLLLMWENILFRQSSHAEALADADKRLEAVHEHNRNLEEKQEALENELHSTEDEMNNLKKQSENAKNEMEKKQKQLQKELDERGW